MTDFEITQDIEFLKHFWNYREIFKLSPEMVEKLRKSEDPYGKYGYGQWLYRVRPDGAKSMKEAKRCFESASADGVADAKQMLSYMTYNGDSYNEDKGGIWEKSNVMALILNVQAQEEGSELAFLRKNHDLFWGNIVPARRDTAIAEAIERMKDSEAPLLWLAQAGGFYEAEGRTDEAIEAYEKCIAGGLYYPIYDLAFIHFANGEMEKYDALMKEGIEKGVADCSVWGIEHEDNWDELSAEQQKEIHDRLAANLPEGIRLGGNFSAYILAYAKFYGMFGFEKDLAGALEAAHKGVALHCHLCCGIILDIMGTDGIEEEIPEEMLLTDEEYAMIVLKAVRYGDDSRLESIIRCWEEFTDMGYGEEVKYWTGVWKEKQKSQELEVAVEAVEPVEKTEIEPTVLIIHPSGYTDFVEADVNTMSFKEMAELIDADGVDAVHFSDSLTKITKACGLKRNVTMYVDRNAQMKDLEDNTVGTMLYGRGYEIRGAVIIAMEDSRYDTYSFDTEEDIENVYEAIDELTGLLRRETDDDGRYDPWA